MLATFLSRSGTALRLGARSAGTAGTAGTFAHRVDAYDCVEVQEDLGGLSPAAFGSRLSESLAAWAAQGRQGAWVKIKTAHAPLVPEAIAQGLLPHHASPDAMTFSAWLGEGEESKLPPAASHFVGVAGFVLNSRRELLVIREASGPAAAKGLWKLPGGLVGAGEDYSAAVVREVLEETGLPTRYCRTACLVESHHSMGPSRDGASDVYTICALVAEDEAAPLTPQASEIADCKWMCVDEVLRLKFYEQGVFGEAMRVALGVAEGRLAGMGARRVPLAFREGEAALTFAAEPLASS